MFSEKTDELVWLPRERQSIKRGNIYWFGPKQGNQSCRIQNKIMCYTKITMIVFYITYKHVFIFGTVLGPYLSSVISEPVL